MQKKNRNTSFAFLLLSFFISSTFPLLEGITRLWEKSLFNTSVTRSNASAPACFPNGLKTLFVPISQAQNLYTQYHKPHEDSLYTSMTYRFQQAGNAAPITQSIFGYDSLTFVGDSVGASPRPQNALVPEYFGLSPDSNFSFSLAPQIRNQIIDLEVSLQASNLWFQVNLPLVKSYWTPYKKRQEKTDSIVATPLEAAAEVYIYNVGQNVWTSVKSTDPLPPCGTESTYVGYNTLPPIYLAATSFKSSTDAREGDLGPLKRSCTFSLDLNDDPVLYNGAYIVSAEDASDPEASLPASCVIPDPRPSAMGATPFAVSEQNKGAIAFGEAIYEEGFSGDAELSSESWVLPLGKWNCSYTAYSYTASTKAQEEGKDVVVDASLREKDAYETSGIVSNVVADAPEEGVNTLLIQQEEVPAATSIEEALGGEYSNQYLPQRKYGNINFNYPKEQANWGSSDIILWAGWDVMNHTEKHIGLYLHGVIPAGTKINEEWSRYVLAPVKGNGGHYELGGGLTARMTLLTRGATKYEIHANGYVDHVFAARQFRVFDHNASLPMSRYAVIKKVSYIGAQDEGIPDAFNDDYQFESFDFLGHVNNAYLDVSNNLRSEVIVDFIIEGQAFDLGFGYAFSGLTADNVSSDCIPKQKSDLSEPGVYYYGYKGNTNISQLIVANIQKTQEKFDSAVIPTKDSAPLAYRLSSITENDAAVYPGNTLYIKSSGNVVASGDSGVYSYGESPFEESTDTDYAVTSEDDVFALPAIKDNMTGLMPAQILNRLFAHCEYTWNDTFFRPTIGILGSYGFQSNTYLTCAYYDVGCYFAVSY
jgi:hypothetical protein